MGWVVAWYGLDRLQYKGRGIVEQGCFPRMLMHKVSGFRDLHKRARRP